MDYVKTMDTNEELLKTLQTLCDTQKENMKVLEDRNEYLEKRLGLIIPTGTYIINNRTNRRVLRKGDIGRLLCRTGDFTNVT